MEEGLASCLGHLKKASYQTSVMRVGCYCRSGQRAGKHRANGSLTASPSVDMPFSWHTTPHGVMSEPLEPYVPIPHQTWQEPYACAFEVEDPAVLSFSLETKRNKAKPKQDSCLLSVSLCLSLPVFLSSPLPFPTPSSFTVSPSPSLFLLPLCLPSPLLLSPPSTLLMSAEMVDAVDCS